MNLLITGGTGLIGRHLGIELVRRGHTLVGLTRDASKARLQAPYPAQWVECDITQATPDLRNHVIDGAIHLAGENVGERAWTPEQKKKIKTSRDSGTQNLLRALASHPETKFLVGASAMGYYGPTEEDKWTTEESPRGDGFLAEVTASWEAATLAKKEILRTTLFRIGIVLTPEGGALPKMLFPAQIFASSALGSGRQWMSWVHIEDVVGAFIHAVENENSAGIYNLVAPSPEPQKTLARAIAERLGVLYGPPVPGFMIRLLIGEQASLALTSLKVSSQKLQDAGFKFKFKTLDDALKDLLQGWSDGAAVKSYQQYFPRPRADIFRFFSSAENLEKITPAFLKFKIKRISDAPLKSGSLIDYSLRIHGVPVQWQTRIETWAPNQEFSDRQMKGPYNLWYHSHTFEDLGGGTLMTDTIQYRMPLGLLGRLMAQALVDKDIDTIFNFRRREIERHL